MSSDANYKFWGNGERGDVALSYEEYFDVIDCVRDEALTKQTKMNFKNLHEVNSFGLLYIPLYTAPVAFGLTRLVLGNAKRGHSGYRPMWTLLSVMWPLTCWVGYTTPMPRKLYTNIIADQGVDGTYIRQQLKQSKPGLWRNVSRRLYKENYMFPEMHECTTKTEFPSDFVNPHAF